MSAFCIQVISPSHTWHCPGSVFSIRGGCSRWGRLDLCSRPGHGTTATLVMPLLATRESSASLPNTIEPAGRTALRSKKGHPASPPPLNGHPHVQSPAVRVLIADDHAMVRRGLCGLPGRVPRHRGRRGSGQWAGSRSPRHPTSARRRPHGCEHAGDGRPRSDEG